MTEGIMDSFRARREELAEASRLRQQELKQEAIAAEMAAAAAAAAATEAGAPAPEGGEE
jgi:nucleoside phosphorylase